MANSKSGAGRSGQLSNYKTNKTWERNRIRKLNRTIKAQPNNKQPVEAIGNIVYRRKTPKTQFWNKTRIYTAYLYKYFSGRVNLDFFSNNEKVSTSAHLSHRMKWNFKPLPVNEKSMFSLGARAHTRGNQWA